MKPHKNRKLVQDWLRDLGMDPKEYSVEDELAEDLDQLQKAMGLLEYDTGLPSEDEYYEILVINQLGIDFSVRCEPDKESKLLKIIIFPKKKESPDDLF